MAYLLSELVRYYHAFGVNIIDHTMEEGRLGLELNLFKLNQRRIANVHYLGELYNYRLVDHGVVFDFMYFLLRFGHG